MHARRQNALRVDNRHRRVEIEPELATFAEGGRLGHKATGAAPTRLHGSAPPKCLAPNYLVALQSQAVTRVVSSNSIPQ